MPKQSPMLALSGQFRATKKIVYWTTLLAPLIVIPWFVDGYNLPKMALLCGGVGIALFSAWRESPDFHIKLSSLDAVLLFWLALYGVATIYSVNIFQSVWGQYRFHGFGLITAVAGFALYFLLRTTGAADNARKGLMTAGAVIAVFALIEYIIGGNRGRINSLSGSPIYYSGFLAPLAPIALAEYLKTKKLNWLVLFTLYLFALAVSMARGSWLATAVALCVLGTFAFFRTETRKQVFTAAAVIAVVIISALLFTPVVSKVSTIGQSEYYSNVSRVEGWKSAVSAIKLRPLTGYGPDNFIFAFRNNKTEKYFRVTGKNMAQAHAHNDMLQMAATAGIPCALIYIAAWVMILWSGGKKASRSMTDSGLFAASIALFIYLQFNNGMSGTVLLFWVLAASINADKVLANGKRHFRSFTPLLAAGLLMASAIPLASEILFVRGTYLSVQGNSLAAIRSFDSAYRLSPYVNSYYRASQNTAASYAQKVDDPPYRSKLLRKAVQTAQLNARRNAANPDAWHNLAAMLVTQYKMTGEDTRTAAANAAIESIRRDPYNPDALAGLAGISVLLGREEQAERLWKGAVELDPANKEAEKYYKRREQKK